MHINMSASLPNPSGETHARSADAAESGTAEGFLAQMGQILNRNDQSNNTHGEPTKSKPTANSKGKDAPNSLKDSGLATTPRRAMKSTTDLNFSDSISQPSLASGTASGEMQIAAAAAGVGDPSVAPVVGMESDPVQKSEKEQGGINPVAAFQFAGDFAAGTDQAQSIIAADFDACADARTQQQNAGGMRSSVAPERGIVGADDTVSSTQNYGQAKKIGADAEIAPSVSIELKADLVKNLQAGGFQSDGKLQPSWSIPARTPESTNDFAVSSNSTAQNVQLNFDFGNSGGAGLPQGISKQNTRIAEAQDDGFADSLALPGNEGSQNELSATALLKKSPKPMQSFREDADMADASANQWQTASKSVVWTTVHGKPEDTRLYSTQHQLSDVEVKSERESAFAAVTLKNGESLGGANVSTAQTSKSRAPEFVLQLADQIHMQVKDGKGEIRIQLKPDIFGRLEIRAENTIHGMSARISTESNAVKSYLESNLQSLQQALQDQGLRIDRIHIIVQDAFDSQSSSGFSAQFGHAGSGQNGKGPQYSSLESGSSPVNPTEEEILDPASWLALNPNNRFYTVA